MLPQALRGHLGFDHVDLEVLVFMISFTTLDSYALSASSSVGLMWPIGRDLMDTSRLGLGVLRSLNLCIMCVFISVSICYRKKYLWQRLSKTLNYVFTQKSTKVILLLCLFTCWTVVFFFYLRCQRYLISGCWLSKQCWVEVLLHKMGLKENVIFLGNPLTLCGSIALTHPAGMATL